MKLIRVGVLVFFCFCISLSIASDSGGLTVAGKATTNDLTITALDCSGNANGGTLTTDANGQVVCGDDIAIGPAGPPGPTGPQSGIVYAQDYVTSTSSNTRNFAAGAGKLAWLNFSPYLDRSPDLDVMDMGPGDNTATVFKVIESGFYSITWHATFYHKERNFNQHTKLVGYIAQSASCDFDELLASDSSAVNGKQFDLSIAGYYYNVSNSYVDLFSAGECLALKFHERDAVADNEAEMMEATVVVQRVLN